MKKKGNDILFNFMDLSYDEFYIILNKISITAYQEKLKINSQRTFSEMEELKGYRIQKLPKDKLLPALIKYSKKTNSTVYSLVVEMVNKYCVQIGIRPYYDEYFSDKDINKLCDNTYNLFLEKKIANDIEPWIKIVKFDEHTIPKQIHKINIEDESAITKEVKAEDSTKDSTKDKQEIKKLEKDILKLEDKLKKTQMNSNQKIDELENKLKSLKENEISLFNKYIEKIVNNISKADLFDFNIELSKLIGDNKITTFEQLWNYLSKLENDMVKRDFNTNKENLLSILAIKYALVEGKDDSK